MGTKVLLSSQWEDFAEKLGTCVVKVPTGGIIPGVPAIFSRSTSSEVSVVAIVIAAVSILLNLVLCGFLFFRREYQELELEPEARVHAKGVVLSERACFCLLSTF